MPDAEFGLALFFSGVIFAIGTLLALASGDPDLDPAGLFGAAGVLMLLGLVACVAPSLPGRLRSMPAATATATATATPVACRERGAPRGKPQSDS